MATGEFITAARALAAALGRPNFEPVYVKHAIQDQTDEEIRGRADATFEAIVARLTGSPD